VGRRAENAAKPPGRAGPAQPPSGPGRAGPGRAGPSTCRGGPSSGGGGSRGGPCGPVRVGGQLAMHSAVSWRCTAWSATTGVSWWSLTDRLSVRSLRTESVVSWCRREARHATVACARVCVCVRACVRACGRSSRTCPSRWSVGDAGVVSWRCERGQLATRAWSVGDASVVSYNWDQLVVTDRSLIRAVLADRVSGQLAPS
jgi:hypothetical protein